MLTLSALVITTFIAVQEPQTTATQSQSSQTQTTRSSSRSEQDQTFTVTRGTRVDLLDCTGQVTVRTSPRDAVQVKSSSRRAEVKATLKEKVLLIETSSPMGRDSSSVDYDLTVPAWIDVHIEGHACGIEIDGVAGAVAVKNIEGDITMRAVEGSIDAQSIEGEIEIDGGKGRIKATTSDGNISVKNATGEIDVDTVDGAVTLFNVQSSNVMASSVDGDVEFKGALQATGKYHFETHDGDVILTIPDKSNGSFTIRRYDGDLRTTHPLKATSEERRGRRVTYTLGTGGGAQVEIETFDGDVRIKKPGDKEKDK